MQEKTNISDIERQAENKTLKETLKIVTKQKLLEANTYFGHQFRNWNPKMRDNLLTGFFSNQPVGGPKLSNIHLINVSKTQEALDVAYRLIFNLTRQGVTFLFVGTKPLAKEVIFQQAQRTNSAYVNERWLGGTLTNSRTIFSRLKELERLERLKENGWFGYTKKEILGLEKQLQKLTRNLKGIRHMRSLPQIMIVADPLHDIIAVKEARKKGVKVIGILDSNADPTIVDFGIPANDDSKDSISLIITLLADAIAEAKGEETLFAFKLDSQIILPQDKEAAQIKTMASRLEESRETDSETETHLEKDHSEIDVELDQELNTSLQTKEDQESSQI